MSAADYVAVFIITLFTYGILDSIWLGVLGREFNNKMLKPWLTKDINWIAVVIFYALFSAGLAYFVIIPSFESVYLYKAVMAGAFFGLVTYGTYDLVNYITIKKWPIKYALVDITWGTFVAGSTTGVVYLLAILLNLCKI